MWKIAGHNTKAYSLHYIVCHSLWTLYCWINRCIWCYMANHVSGFHYCFIMCQNINNKAPPPPPPQDKTFAPPLVQIINHIFVIVSIWVSSAVIRYLVCAKGLITLFLYCSKGKLHISLCKQMTTHNLQLKFVLLAYNVTVIVLIL